jgi:hypothetical protein
MQMGSDGFSAQYQQMPVPPGGAMIKRHWIVRYKELPPITVSSGQIEFGASEAIGSIGCGADLVEAS